MADYKYPDSTPVDEPVAKQKAAPKKEPEAKVKPAPKEQKSKPIVYPDSAPVDEPVSKMAKGGSVSASKRADGIAQRGKTRGTMVMCGGGMMKK